MMMKRLPPKKKLVVDKSGAGDYRTLAKAISATQGGTKDSPVTIEINPGTYDIYEEMGGANWLAGISDASSEMQGLLIPPYTNLIGNGSGVWIKGELPAGITKTQSTKISTLNIRETTTLKNLKITAQNMRYAVHDESNNQYPNMIQIAENCTILHYGNVDGLWEYPVAWASGTSSGVTKQFTNCTLEGSTGFSVHDNASQSKGTNIIFNKCTLTGNNPTAEIPNAARFGTYGQSTAVNTVVFNDCNLNGMLSNAPEGNSSTECRWDITGNGGNSMVPQYVLAGTEAGKRYIRFSNEVIELTNNTGATIVSGARVKLVNGSPVVLSTGDTSNSQFYAYCMSPVAAGAKGLFRIAGFMNANQMPASIKTFTKNARIADASILATTDTTSTSAWYGVAMNATYFKVVGYHTGSLPDNLKF